MAYAAHTTGTLTYLGGTSYQQTRAHRRMQRGANGPYSPVSASIMNSCHKLRVFTLFPLKAFFGSVGASSPEQHIPTLIFLPSASFPRQGEKNIPPAFWLFGTPGRSALLAVALL